MKLHNQVAIVTGGSRGIGLATVEKFIREGATVILAASRPETAQKAVEQLKEKYPHATIRGISPELTSLESVQTAFHEIEKEFGRIETDAFGRIYGRDL